MNTIFEKFNKTKNEKNFLKNLNSGDLAHTATANKYKILSSFYLAKTIESETDKNIKSNTESTEANIKYAKELNKLTEKLSNATWVLVFVTVVLVFIELYKLFK